MLFAENKQINGSARNALTGTVHNPELSKAGGCQVGSKDSAVLPPSSGTRKHSPCTGGRQLLSVAQVKRERGKEGCVAQPNRVARWAEPDPEGSQQEACSLGLGSSLLPGSFLDGFLPF